MTTDILIESEPPYTLEDRINDNQGRQKRILERLAALEALEEQREIFRRSLAEVLTPRKAYECLNQARLEIQSAHKDLALYLYEARKNGDYLKSLDKSQAV